LRGNGPAPSGIKTLIPPSAQLQRRYNELQLRAKGLK